MTANNSNTHADSAKGLLKSGVETGHKVILAGVGVCKEGQELTSKQLDNVVENGTSTFNQLVSRGALVEHNLKQRLFGGNMLKQKIDEIKSFLGVPTESREQQIEQLSTKVDNLIEAVAKLAEKKVKEQEEKERQARAASTASADKSASATSSAAKTASSAGSTKAASTSAPKRTASKSAGTAASGKGTSGRTTKK